MTDLHFLTPKESLSFMGTVGIGKTHLATAIALRACQAGRTLQLFSSSTLANLLLKKNNKGTLNNFPGTLKRWS